MPLRGLLSGFLNIIFKFSATGIENLRDNWNEWHSECFPSPRMCKQDQWMILWLTVIAECDDYSKRTEA